MDGVVAILLGSFLNFSGLPLARVSHQLAAADPGMFTSLRSVGRLDDPSSTPRRPPVARLVTIILLACLRRLAAKSGEKIAAGGLSERRHALARIGRACRLGFRQVRGEILARVDELVGFEIILLVVQLPVPSVDRQQPGVSAALDDFARLEHEDLIRATDGREAMRDDEGGAPAAQPLEAVLYHRLTFTVEAGRRFVQDQNSRIGQNRTRDADALALSAGQLDAAFTHHRVVLFFEAFDELLAMGDPAGLTDLLARGARARKPDVVGDGAVEKEILLHHGTQQ